MGTMTFIELTVNPFDNVFSSQTNQKQMAKRGAGADSVRRPLRGIEIKDDTYAVMRVVKYTGEEIPLISSSYRGGYGPSYTNFILQRVTEAREEKVQIIETFGIPYIFLFGQRPMFLEVQALLVNTLDFNWEAEFWANYDQYLRGTKCAENGARVYLMYDDNIVEGYMLKASADKQAADKGQQIPLQFTMLLTNYANVSMVDSSTYPVRPSSMVMAYPYLSEDSDQVVNSVGIDADSVPWLTPSTLTSQQLGSLDFENSATRNGLPLRSDITDNLDEWTGDQYQASSTDWDPSILLGDQNLAGQAIDNAQQLGADSDNPSFLQGLGLLGGGASAFASAQAGGSAGFGGMGASAQAGASAGLSGSSAYAGAGAWAGAGVGPGGAWSDSGTWSFSYSGAGGGYYNGQAVGYDQFGSLQGGGGGSIGFYAGAGYYGPGQSGTPGFGSGTSPASLGFSEGSGAYAGWSPGTGAYSGSYSYGGQGSPSNMPSGPGYSGSIWMPSTNYQGYGVMAGYSAGSSQQLGYAGASASFGAGVGFGATGRNSLGNYQGGAFYGGANNYMPYAAPGYASGSYGGGTASSQYYASAYAGWDPVNGAYSGSYSSGPGGMNNGTPPSNTSGPMPGQPGGGIFTVQAYGMAA